MLAKYLVGKEGVRWDKWCVCREECGTGQQWQPRDVARAAARCGTRARESRMQDGEAVSCGAGRASHTQHGASQRRRERRGAEGAEDDVKTPHEATALSAEQPRKGPRRDAHLRLRPGCPCASSVVRVLEEPGWERARCGLLQGLAAAARALSEQGDGVAAVHDPLRLHHTPLLGRRAPSPAALLQRKGYAALPVRLRRCRRPSAVSGASH
jgi:hypothetical protein